VNDLDAGDSRACAVSQEARSPGVRHQSDVGQMHNLPDAIDIGIGLGVNEAGIAVAGVAANAPRVRRLHSCRKKIEQGR